MPTPRTWPALACALLLGTTLHAAAPAAAPPRPAADVARDIDAKLAAAWKAAGAEPAPGADDAEWLRRVYLDLAGRIPSVREARTFLDDARADRRERLVASLLASPRFNTHFATVFRHLLLPEADSNFQVRFQVNGFESALRGWLESGKGYDALVKALVTYPVAGGRMRAGFGFGSGEANLGAYYSAKENKSEEIAAAVSRTFLGVNIGCAQCHNHPFASWKRDDFWKFAAFFGGIKTQRQGDFTVVQRDDADGHEIDIPNTDRKAKAAYLGGKAATIAKGSSARGNLADWIVSRDNPYFARAVVNRTWAHFFGVGLMEPLDNMAGCDIVPAQPEVLDLLAKDFAANGYDVRRLMRVIVSTKAYALSSKRGGPGSDSAGLFARMPLRGLTAEQLYDSLAQATGLRGESGRGMRVFGGANTGRAAFIEQFANDAERPVDVQRSILQALTLMNGSVMTAATDVKEAPTLAAVSDAPFMDTARKVEALYLAALTRKPTAKELARLVSYVDRGGVATKGDDEEKRGAALADVFWALLNSAEFTTNH